MRVSAMFQHGILLFALGNLTLSFSLYCVYDNFEGEHHRRQISTPHISFVYGPGDDCSCHVGNEYELNADIVFFRAGLYYRRSR